MRCPKCAQLIAEISRECPYCHEVLNIEAVNHDLNKRKDKEDEDIQNNNLTYIFTFIPLAGLIYFLNNKDRYPLKSGCALKGFKYNTTIIIVALIVFLLVNIV